MRLVIRHVDEERLVRRGLLLFLKPIDGLVDDKLTRAAAEWTDGRAVANKVLGVDMRRAGVVLRGEPVIETCVARLWLRGVIEPTIALKIPSATYIYVSPEAPRLAKRIEKDMKILLKSGELSNIFNRFYEKDIKRATLNNRKIIEVDNPFYLEQDKLNDSEYFYKL